MVLKKLKDISDIQRKIDKMQTSLDKWQAISKRVAGGQITDNPIYSTTNCASFEHIVLIIKDLKDEIEKLAREVDLLREEVVPYIEEVDDAEEKTILKLKYIDGLSMREISKVIYMSKTAVHRKYNVAISKLR